MDQRRLTTSGVDGFGSRPRGLNGRLAGFAVLLVAGAAMLVYGTVSNGRQVQLPQIEDDATAAEEAAHVGALSADWAAALEGDMFGDPSVIIGFDDASAAAAKTAASAAPAVPAVPPDNALAATDVQWRSEFWLIKASTVGGVNREGGQLLQTYAEGEIPSLCPT